MRTPCSVEDCPKPVKGDGLCAMHLWRWRQHGDVHHVERILHDDERRFLSRLSEITASGCVLWGGSCTDTGYGQIRFGRRLVRAHRWAYEHWIGPIPEGLELDHLCHNESGCLGGDSCPHRRCVNPAHLEPVTHAVNSKRGRNGAHLAERTHCPKGHEYTPENTKRNGAGHRSCRECARASGREYQRQKRAGLR